MTFNRIDFTTDTHVFPFGDGDTPLVINATRVEMRSISALLTNNDTLKDRLVRFENDSTVIAISGFLDTISIEAFTDKGAVKVYGDYEFLSTMNEDITPVFTSIDGSLVVDGRIVTVDYSKGYEFEFATTEDMLAAADALDKGEPFAVRGAEGPGCLVLLPNSDKDVKVIASDDTESRYVGTTVVLSYELDGLISALRGHALG